MKEHQKIVVFDFDGVVCDSTDECMLTSWNAWERWETRSSFRDDLSQFTKEDKLNFRRLRPRVKGAGEYYILRRAFSEGISIEDQEFYNKLEQNWHEYFDVFKRYFFDAREQLRKDNLDAWIDLHPVFDDIIKVMKYLNKKNRLFIATLKDAESVKLILKKQGIELRGDCILDQAKIKTKSQALDQIRNDISCTKKDMIFIDDNVLHLLKPHKEGYEVFLTGWGQVISEYVNIAKTNNIRILNECSLLQAII